MKKIYTKRLILRPYKLEDIDSVHRYASNSDIVKYTLFGPNTYDETEAFISKIINYDYKQEPIRNLEYAIEFHDNVIGGVSIHINESFTEGEVGWILNPSYHNQGIVSEAAKALKEYVLEKYSLERIIAHCDSRNIASQKVMIKIGMKQVSVDKNTRINKKTGIYEFDNLLYEINL